MAIASDRINLVLGDEVKLVLSFLRVMEEITFLLSGVIARPQVNNTISTTPSVLDLPSVSSWSKVMGWLGSSPSELPSEPHSEAPSELVSIEASKPVMSASERYEALFLGHPVPSELPSEPHSETPSEAPSEVRSEAPSEPTSEPTSEAQVTPTLARPTDWWTIQQDSDSDIAVSESESDSDWSTMQQDIADPGTLAWLELSKKEISSATRSKETTRRPN